MSTNEPIREGPSSPPLPTAEPPDAAEVQRRVERSARWVGRGTTVMVASTLFLFAASLIARIAAARALGPAVWGSFNLGVSFTSLLSVVILLGLNQAVARSLAFEQDETERHAIVRWSLIVSGTISTVASILTFLFAAPIAGLFHDPALVGILQLLAVSVGFGAITPVYASIFQGFHNVVPNAVFNQILNPALFAVFVVAFLYAGLGLLGCLIAYVIADAAGLIGIAIYYDRRIGKYLPSLATARRFPHRRLWSLSAALWGVASLAFVTAFADTLILGAYWPSTQVGYYSTAMTLARVLLLGGSALTYVTLPIAARLAREKAYPELGLTYVTATRWTLFLSFPLLLLFGVLPSLTIRELFGAAYLPAAFPLQFLVITAFLSTAFGPVNATLAGLGKKENQATVRARFRLDERRAQLRAHPILRRPGRGDRVGSGACPLPRPGALAPRERVRDPSLPRHPVETARRLAGDRGAVVRGGPLPPHARLGDRPVVLRGRGHLRGRAPPDEEPRPRGFHARGDGRAGLPPPAPEGEGVHGAVRFDRRGPHDPAGLKRRSGAGFPARISRTACRTGTRPAPSPGRPRSHGTRV